ncbi:hypothetical protein FGO68_gene14476 [Halteria grandinella]|uniref:Uncharacterized protein n=1 Tax=Halteria grandinella TaxID=5974 RepID=A0A8J8NNS5_HALGN|nr:hypothetical protein FGO68_gene14476 [Halteria grandinella]
MHGELIKRLVALSSQSGILTNQLSLWEENINSSVILGGHDNAQTPPAVLWEYFSDIIGEACDKIDFEYLSRESREVFERLVLQHVHTVIHEIQEQKGIIDMQILYKEDCDLKIVRTSLIQSLNRINPRDIKFSNILLADRARGILDKMQLADDMRALKQENDWLRNRLIEINAENDELKKLLDDQQMQIHSIQINAENEKLRNQLGEQQMQINSMQSSFEKTLEAALLRCKEDLQAQVQDMLHNSLKQFNLSTSQDPLLFELGLLEKSLEYDEPKQEQANEEDRQQLNMEPVQNLEQEEHNEEGNQEVLFLE